MNLKSTIGLIIISIISLASCGPKNNFTIKGNLPDSSFEGQEVILYDYDTRAAMDTVVVKDSSFIFKGQVKEGSQFVQVVLNRMNTAIFVTPGEYTINPTVDLVAKEGQLNMDYSSLLEKLNAINKQKQALYMEFKSKKVSEEEISAQFEAWDEELVIDLESIYNANKDNALGFFALSNLLNYIETEEANAIFDVASEYILNREVIKSHIKTNKAITETSPGAMFKDFTVTQPDSTKVSFSEYVGNGKYTLVDFWASWCGPCINELPHIKAVNNEFSSDNFQVIGVASWDKPDHTLKAIEQHDIPWNNIINAQSIGTDLYGIKGIPHIILFAPDGTIIARGDEMRGEKMREQVAKALGKK